MVDFFDDETQIVTIRVNGGMHKSQQEFTMDWSSENPPTLKVILKETCKRFGVKDKAACAVLFNKKGIQIFDEDVSFIKANDTLYIALDGEPFNNCAILDDYTISEKIGEGGFGTVHLATNKESNKQFAVKFMDMTQTLHSADAVNGIYKEANSIQKLRHKNIVELYHSFVEGKQLIMIMELARGGELMEHVQKEGRLTEQNARKILIQIVNAIQYCHSHGVVHRDLKLENILFKDVEDLFVKVIDFGISGVCTTFQADAVDAGTIVYMPPECFEGHAVTSPALDIWAIGLMFYAMLYGCLPFYGANESETKQKIRKAQFKFPKDIPVTDEAKEVICQMLKKDPEERIGLLQFMDMTYYSMNDDVHDQKVQTVTQAHQAEVAAEEEKRSEADELARQFQQLDLPSQYGGASAAGRRPGASPGRVAKKKKSSKAAAGSSPRNAAGAASGSATRTSKNKKTTK